jgi:beta-galactosidase
MTEKNSRWYTGGGLFRNVSLVTTASDLYFERYPLYITTRDNKYVSLSADYTNRTKAKQTTMKVSIYNPAGQLVAEQTCQRGRNPQTRTLNIKMQEVEIQNPQLWDTENPNLYKAVARLVREDGSIADEISEQFGIRTVEYGPDFGLKLNGKKVILKGYANHHTLGALGAAAYPRAIEKRIQLMKQFGMNHIRTSHNPYSRDFIKLCDKYGILVVDERVGSDHFRIDTRFGLIIGVRVRKGAQLGHKVPFSGDIRGLDRQLAGTRRECQQQHKNDKQTSTCSHTNRNFVQR